MLSNPEQLSIIENAERVEKLLHELKATSKRLTDMQDKLKVQLADINKNIADNNTPPISVQKVEKLIGLKTELGLLTLANNRATEYLKTTTTNIKKLSALLTELKNQLKTYIKKNETAIQSIQKSFKKSSRNTENILNSLEETTSKIENSEINIITKKRQTVLSQDETRYNMIMFCTLIAINVTLLIYIFYLVHK